jgi:hypothetical protein
MSKDFGMIDVAVGLDRALAEKLVLRVELPVHLNAAHQAEFLVELGLSESDSGLLHSQSPFVQGIMVPGRDGWYQGFARGLRGELPKMQVNDMSN